jgi:hypothetical protein
MIPMIAMGVLAGISASPKCYGYITGGIDGRCSIMDRRWRVVPDGDYSNSSKSYDWEILSRSSKIGSPYILKISMPNGVQFTRHARCNLHLPNYISLDSPNLSGVDEVFRDNSIYYLDSKNCVMQNTWFMDKNDVELYGPYFINKEIPLMRSIDVTNKFKFPLSRCGGD